MNYQTKLFFHLSLRHCILFLPNTRSYFKVLNLAILQKVDIEQNSNLNAVMHLLGGRLIL